MQHTTMVRALIPAWLLSLSACGFASVSPIVTDADIQFDARLVGTWTDSAGEESARITRADAGTYSVEYRDDAGKTGRFEGRLGRIGQFRVLDLQPSDPAPRANDMYKSLIVRAHGVVVLDSIGDALVFRLVESDSVKAFLQQRPDEVPHSKEGGILLTGSSEQVRRFLATFMARPGVLGDQQVWPRKAAG